MRAGSDLGDGVDELAGLEAELTGEQVQVYLASRVGGSRKRTNAETWVRDSSLHQVAECRSLLSAAPLWRVKVTRSSHRKRTKTLVTTRNPS